MAINEEISWVGKFLSSHVILVSAVGALLVLLPFTQSLYLMGSVFIHMHMDIVGP